MSNSTQLRTEAEKLSNEVEDLRVDLAKQNVVVVELNSKIRKIATKYQSIMRAVAEAERARPQTPA